MRRKLTSLLVITAIGLSFIGMGLVWSQNARAEATAANLSPTDVLTMVMSYIRTNSLKDVSVADLVEGALKGMVDSLGDPHSEYIAAKDYQAASEDISGTFGGIGVNIELRDGYVTVVSPIPGTPAERAGILPGDQIVEVDGKNVVGQTLEEVAKLVRGQPGTSVTIGIKRPPRPETIPFAIVRALIEVNPVDVKYFADDTVGYIALSQFNAHTTQHLQVALQAFGIKNVHKVILDLRGNPGGYLNEALSVASSFLPPNTPLVRLVGREGEEVPNSQRVPYNALGDQVIVLVDKGSASASEIVAGALQDYAAAILVGERTYGKGTVQNITGLPTGGGIRLTVAEYFSPLGKKIDGTGITPDVPVPSYDLAAAQEAVHQMNAGRKLARGDVGLDVLGLQNLLRVLGFAEKDPDGVFGPSTATAVVAFQKAAGLKATGLMDEDTYAKLNLAARSPESAGLPDRQLDKALQILTEAH